MIVLRGVRPWGGPAADVELADGHVRAIRPHDPTAPIGAGDVAGDGRLLLPAFVDAHVHLDSTRLGLPFRPFTGGRTVLEQVANDRAHWRAAGASVADRAAHTLGLAISSGMTAARSHVQIDTDCRLERFTGVLQAVEQHRDRADVEIIAFPQAGVVRDPGTADLLDEALRLGAHTVGGLDPCAVDRDPVRQLDVVFALAERYGAGIDLHIHEPGDLGLFSMELVLERVRALSYEGRVTISHAFALSDSGGAHGQQARRDSIVDLIAEHDVALTTIAPTPERALPFDTLRARGVRVGLGQDGQRDYWSPYGNGDMLDRTWQLAFTNGFRDDEHIEQCLEAATTGGAALMDRRVHARTVGRARTIEINDAAEFVLVHGDTPTAAVMDRSGGRTTVHRGIVVADDGALR